MREAIAQARDLLFTTCVYNTEKRSQMCEIHLYEAALRGPAGGECVFL